MLRKQTNLVLIKFAPETNPSSLDNVKLAE